MNSPVVSIIIPVYNVEQYLDECLDTVMNQTLKNIEIILVDDESPDNCPELCDRYAQKDSRIKVVHKKNGGLGFARNSGLDIATGEFVTFIDSDDKVDTNVFSYLLNKYKDINPDVIYYRYCRFSDSTAPIIKRNNAYTIIEKEQLIALKLDIIAPTVKDKRERCIECSACTSIYRRSILEQNGLRFHSERELISEDMIFNLDVLTEVSKVVFDTSELYCYRENPMSLTRSYRPNKVMQMGAFSRYLSDSYTSWNLPADEVQLRIARLTIGYIRSYLDILLANTNMSNMKKYFIESASIPELHDSIKKYPWWNYSPYHMVFYFALKFKSYGMAKMISRVKSMLQ